MKMEKINKNEVKEVIVVPTANAGSFSTTLYVPYLPAVSDQWSFSTPKFNNVNL